ncbi:hypothetical protein [Mesobacillus harenae]|uniref:hypothetical protein n=1 Tax=Mesobacillus harenae TaxID=2213203 RepID=UPI001580A7F3|nr:hypothetical protein [Mesobacillus harenae]
MSQFKITYFFGGDLSISKTVEKNEKAEVIQEVKDNAGLVEFTEKDKYYRFDTKDIKLYTVEATN